MKRWPQLSSFQPPDSRITFIKTFLHMWDGFLINSVEINPGTASRETKEVEQRKKTCYVSLVPQTAMSNSKKMNCYLE